MNRTIDPTILDLARRVCTPAELQALELEARGLSQHNIALALGIGRWAVRSRIDNAWRKITIARKETAA